MSLASSPGERWEVPGAPLARYAPILLSPESFHHHPAPHQSLSTAVIFSLLWAVERSGFRVTVGCAQPHTLTHHRAPPCTHAQARTILMLKRALSRGRVRLGWRCFSLERRGGIDGMGDGRCAERRG